MNQEKDPTNREALREVLYEVILGVAPDLTREDLGPDVDLRYELGLDSIDSLNIATGIANRTGLEIPETDRAHLATVDALLAYMTENLVTPG